jgi:hypothetical protein
MCPDKLRHPAHALSNFANANANQSTTHFSYSMHMAHASDSHAQEISIIVTPFLHRSNQSSYSKKEITVVDDIIELRTTILQFDRVTHFVGRVKGYAKEHI